MTKKQAGTAPVEATALPAETARTPKTTQVALANLQELVKVCAFAITADRTLRDLAAALQHHPDAQPLHRLASAPALDGYTAAAVLDRVADEMAALYHDLSEAE